MTHQLRSCPAGSTHVQVAEARSARRAAPLRAARGPADRGGIFATVIAMAMALVLVMAATAALANQPQVAAVSTGPPVGVAAAASDHGAASEVDDAAAASDDQWITAGRGGLGRGWLYPWYDASKDQVRRIEPPPDHSWLDWLLSAGLPELSWLSWLAWGLVALLLVALAALLIWFFLQREDTRNAPLVTADDALEAARIEALPLDVYRPTGNLLESARAAYREGRLAEAVVYLFSHQLFELDRGHLIRLARGKTNRQYLREIAAREITVREVSGRAGAGDESLRDVLEATMVLFEDTIFGRRPVDPARLEACWARLPHFDARLAQAAGGPP